MELEEHRHNLADVTPVTGIVGLDEEQTAGHERSMHQGEKARRDETQVDLSRLVVRLRMIAVDLGGTVRRQVALKQAHSVGDGEADVAQAALVGATRGVADDDRQYVDAEVIV